LQPYVLAVAVAAAASVAAATAGVCWLTGWPFFSLAPALAAMAASGRMKLLGLVLAHPKVLPQAIHVVEELHQRQQARASWDKL